MKKMNLCLIVVLILFLAGCGPAMSLFPLYHDSDIVAVDSMVGEWTQQELKDESQKNSLGKEGCCWKIEPGDGGSYNMSFPLGKGNSHKLRVAIRVLKLDGKLFVDVAPQDIDPEKDKSTDVTFPSVPAHFFGRIWIEKDHIKMKLLEQDWLREAILKKQVRLDYVYPKDFLLTANTDDLQHFAILFAENGDAFKDEYELVRK
jgi:hypothetical protein